MACDLKITCKKGAEKLLKIFKKIIYLRKVLNPLKLKFSQVLKVCKKGAEKLLKFSKKVLKLCKKGAESAEIEIFRSAENM